MELPYKLYSTSVKVIKKGGKKDLNILIIIKFGEVLCYGEIPFGFFIFIFGSRVIPDRMEL